MSNNTNNTDNTNNNNFDILCVGPGGNGQTFFMEFMKNHFNINPHIEFTTQIFGLKHLFSPEKLKMDTSKLKVIYVYNNSFDSICSHFRRKWALCQIRKLHGTKQVFTGYKDVNDYFHKTEETLIDHFGVEKHFKQWFLNKKNLNIYYLNMSDLDKTELAEFLDCNQKIFDQLNYDKNKRHNYDDVKINNPLSTIFYKNLDSKMEELASYHNKKLFLN